MTWNAKTLHVTPTGRARPNGITTRASQSVRKTKYVKGQDRPLDFERACHPQALTRTSRNPDCETNRSQYNVTQWGELSVSDFINGVGLARSAKDLGSDYMCLYLGQDQTEFLGFAQTHRALAYRNAASRAGVELYCYMK